MDVFYLLRDQVFVWDGQKAVTNRAKHGVEFEEACEAFFDDFSFYEDASIDNERRVALLGESKVGLLYVVHLEREREHIRIISARPMSRQERKLYENS